MKLILVSDKLGSSKTVNVSVATLSGVAVSIVLVLGLLFGSGLYVGRTTDQVLEKKAELDTLVVEWQQSMQQQQTQVNEASEEARHQLKALSVRMAQLQARLIRMEAVGERITKVAKLDRGEFDFQQEPAVGGPGSFEGQDETNSVAMGPNELLDSLQQLQNQLDDREHQLSILESLLENRNVADQGYLAGRPIRKGWMSSPFGKRVDPFHGRLAWHKGVDFAGKEDAEIIAVASGVVTWSGDRYGYGDMVEVNHGNGYVTRYAHNKKNLVTVGEVVKKGQVIARMGSSGRSTGPHVHFEVYKNGKAVDPKRYIYRADRT